ncbi:NADH:ubiquinone reductase [Coniochaeta sp. PMI_546]|nr:NADH:ubiquinone reductase [Coniochaeta sp. PMI_546]
MSNPPREEHPYHPQDAIRQAGIATAITGGSGLAAAAIKSAMSPQNIGAFGAFTRFGGTIAVWSAVGGVFQFSKTAAANLREQNDHYNSAIGGFLGGSILGMQKRSMPRILGYGALFSVVLAVFDYTGSSLKGSRRTQELDEFDRKEYLRKNRRRPLEETLAEVGEGRSIRPPGYEERRRERLKERYGFEVNPVSADPDA